MNVRTRARLDVVVCAKNYPTPAHPHQGAFLQVLVSQFVEQGAGITVVSPQPWKRHGRTQAPAAARLSEQMSVLRPDYPSLTARRLGPLRLGRVTSKLFRASAARAVRSQRLQPDLFYGHFMFLGGDAAVTLGRRLHIPSVIALGESDISRYERWLGLNFVRRTADAATGLIAVSTGIRDYCVHTLGISPDRILLAPNAVDCYHFRPLDRAAARARLGWPSDRPIVAFVGQFSERKGVNRALQAIRHARSAPLGVFLGSGPNRPRGASVLHSGAVAHEEVPLYLSAADAFLLPTLAEGSCNAILEALACGLPIVSSDIPAISSDFGSTPPLYLTNPHDTDAMADRIDGILRLRDHEIARLKGAARRLAEGRSIEKRAARILDWLEKLVQAPGDPPWW